MTTETTSAAPSRLPCPFCGSNIIAHHDVEGRNNHSFECCECLASSMCKPTHAEALEAWNRRTQPTGAGVPGGYTLVLVEPTDDMFISGMEADCAGRPSVDDDGHVRSIWNAMLAASPPPPVPQTLDEVRTLIPNGFDKEQIREFILSNPVPQTVAREPLTDAEANAIALAAFEKHCGRPHPWEGAQPWVIAAIKAAHGIVATQKGDKPC